MKFVITRTSSGSGRPCMEATLEKLTELDYLIATPPGGTPQERWDGWYNRWFDRGINHRESPQHPGLLVCDTKNKTPVWTIEINTLDELINFHDKYGSIILADSSDSEKKYKEIPYTIEIYDGWRE